MIGVVVLVVDIVGGRRGEGLWWYWFCGWVYGLSVLRLASRRRRRRRSGKKSLLVRIAGSKSYLTEEVGEGFIYTSRQREIPSAPEQDDLSSVG